MECSNEETYGNHLCHRRRLLYRGLQWQIQFRETVLRSRAKRRSKPLASTLALLDSRQVVSVGPVEEIANQPRFTDFKNGHESGAVLVTVVDHHDRDDGLTYLRIDGKFLKVPLYDASPGTRLRVHVNSRDVALALHPPTGTSVQNILPALVERILEHEGALIDVWLDMGAPITARITRKARRDLGLFPGQQVLVMIKSVAVSRGAIPVSDATADS